VSHCSKKSMKRDVVRRRGYDDGIFEHGADNWQI
jgi:hypothetical protein